MKIDILAFCDFAAFYTGKLCIMGAADMIAVGGFPAIARGNIVIKLQFEPKDVGVHIIKSDITDEDCKALTSSQSDIRVERFEDDPTKYQLKTQVVCHPVQFQIPKPGFHNIGVSVDGHYVHSTPLIVLVFPQKRG